VYTQRTLFDPAAQTLARRSLNERPLREWPIGERPIERLATYGLPLYQMQRSSQHSSLGAPAARTRSPWRIS
jgi:hypothetical protein